MSAHFERIEPFRALTFDPERVGSLNRVVAPPYDLIDRARQDDRRVPPIAPGVRPSKAS